jgi:hypothetical protein
MTPYSTLLLAAEYLLSSSTSFQHFMELKFHCNAHMTSSQTPIPSQVNPLHCRAMAQAVSRRPPTAEARFRSRLIPCGICGGQSGTGTGFSPSTSVFSCQFHSTGARLLGKGQKIVINKPQGCGASVASAAGPFTTKKNPLHSVLPYFFHAYVNALSFRLQFGLPNGPFLSVL